MPERIPLDNTLGDATRFKKPWVIAIPGEIVYNNAAKPQALFYPSGGQAKTPKVYENNSENHDSEVVIAHFYVGDCCLRGEWERGGIEKEEQHVCHI